jgi:D-alanine--poly(phosphoribitol) ligase subunit 2
MPNKAEIEKIVRDLCVETLGFDDLQDEEEFFDRGANSLTVVEMQIKLEKQLQIQVPTSSLMAAPSIQGWIDTYAQAADVGAAAE